MTASLLARCGNRLRYNLHEGQTKAWESDARFTWVLAGTQSGKTSFGPLWLREEINRTADPKGGTNDYIAATASYDLFKLKMLPALRTLFVDTLKIGKYWPGDKLLELCDPSTGEFWAKRADDRMWGRIILRSAAAGGGLESSTARGAWLDECGQDEFTLETWEAVQRRLALRKGRALGTTTPYNLGWMKTEIYDKWTAGDPLHRVIQFPSYFNPLFDRAEFERTKASMPPHRFMLFYCGEFAKPPGLIYDCFDEDIHIVKPFEIPPSWPRTGGVDFGGANTAHVMIAHDPDKDRFIVYRETLEGNLSSAEHCEKRKAETASENVVQWLGGAPSETQQRMDWSDAGIPVMQPYIADVEGGIDRVYALFKTKRLFVFNTCTGLRDELGTYKRKLDDSGQPTDEIQDKRKFHRLDALRYACSGLTGMEVGTGENPWT